MQRRRRLKRNSSVVEAKPYEHVTPLEEGCPSQFRARTRGCLAKAPNRLGHGGARRSRERQYQDCPPSLISTAGASRRPSRWAAHALTKRVVVFGDGQTNRRTVTVRRLRDSRAPTRRAGNDAVTPRGDPLERCRRLRPFYRLAQLAHRRAVCRVDRNPPSSKASRLAAQPLQLSRRHQGKAELNRSSGT